mgnify:CR=1 FL=1
MNKQDLIGKVAEITGMQKSDSEKAVNAVFDQITDVLKQRGEVRLVGFWLLLDIARNDVSTDRQSRLGQ